MAQNKLKVVDEDQQVALSTADGETAQMSLVEHLDEFRGRLIIAAIAFIVATLGCFYFVEFFVGLILRLADGYTLITITPTEIIVEYVKLAVIMGAVLASPIIVYQVWGFISPGMKRHERKAILGAFAAGLLFFIMGVLFAYCLMLPVALRFLQTVDTTQTISPMISIASFISFVLGTVFTFGLVFELPVVVVLLTQLNILKPEWLIKSRKLAIVIIFVVAAIITPPDIMSQCLIGLPMVVLYELSVLAARVIVKRKNKKERQLSGA